MSGCKPPLSLGGGEGRGIRNDVTPRMTSQAPVALLSRLAVRQRPARPPSPHRSLHHDLRDVAHIRRGGE